MLKILKKIINLKVVAILLALGSTAYAGNEPQIPMSELYNVQPGDTLWEIATVYDGGDSNTRRVVYQIKKENQLDSAAIWPGQVIRVPSPSAK